MTDINVENGRCGRLFYDADCAWCAPLAEQVRGLLGRRRIALEPLQSAGVSAALGIPAEKQARVRDLWAHADVGIFTRRFSATVPAHGVVMVRISPVSGS